MLSDAFRHPSKLLSLQEHRSELYLLIEMSLCKAFSFCLLGAGFLEESTTIFMHFLLKKCYPEVAFG